MISLSIKRKSILWGTLLCSAGLYAIAFAALRAAAAIPCPMKTHPSCAWKGGGKVVGRDADYKGAFMVGVPADHHLLLYFIESY